MEEARLCIERACLDVPPKQVSTSLLEYAKYFEIIGEVDRALEIITSVRLRFKSEWKIQFEVVMMYLRCGLFHQAEELVKDSLQIHSSTGRLWAVLI